MTSDVGYIAGTPYVGATVDMFAGPGGYRGESMAWDPVLHLADAKTPAADTVPEPDVVRPSVPSEEPQPMTLAACRSLVRTSSFPPRLK